MDTVRLDSAFSKDGYVCTHNIAAVAKETTSGLKSWPALFSFPKVYLLERTTKY